jgi:hypothetical protein
MRAKLTLGGMEISLFVIQKAGPNRSRKVLDSNPDRDIGYPE